MPEPVTGENSLSTWFANAESARLLRVAVLRRMANPAEVINAEAQQLLGRMTAAPPVAPELWRGLISRASVRRVRKVLQPGNEIHLGPQSFTGTSTIAQHYAPVAKRGQTAVFLSVAAGSSGIAVEGEAPPALRYEGEWIVGGVFTVTSLRDRGSRTLVAELRPVAGLSGVDPRRAVDLKRLGRDLGG